jgi:hypothetical protein
MTRYRGRPFSAKAIERDFPYIVEMRVPLGGFGTKLDAMHEWHTNRGIRALHSTGRRDEFNRYYIRWCFADADAEIAAAFASHSNNSKSDKASAG